MSQPSEQLSHRLTKQQQLRHRPVASRHRRSAVPERSKARRQDRQTRSHIACRSCASRCRRHNRPLHTSTRQRATARCTYPPPASQPPTQHNPLPLLWLAGGQHLARVFSVEGTSWDMSWVSAHVGGLWVKTPVPYRNSYRVPRGETNASRTGVTGPRSFKHTHTPLVGVSYNTHTGPSPVPAAVCVSTGGRLPSLRKGQLSKQARSRL